MVNETFSRYDFMKEGAVVDEATGQAYPDPLSMDYTNLTLTTETRRDVMNDDKISTFWHEAEIAYGSAIYDDMVLNLNGVMHKNLLEKGDAVYFPTASDIKDSFTIGRGRK